MEVPDRAREGSSARERAVELDSASSEPDARSVRRSAEGAEPEISANAERPIPEETLRTVGERPGVLVRLFDRSGAKWDVPSKPVARSLPATWQVEPEVLAVRAETVDGVARAVPTGRTGRRRSERLGPGVIFIPAGRDPAFFVAVVGGSGARGWFDGEPIHCAFTEDEPLHTLDLRATLSEEELGVAVADVRNPVVDREVVDSPLTAAGRGPDRLVQHRARDNARILVERLPSRMPVLEAPWNGNSAPYTFELPAGAYRVRSEFHPGASPSSFGSSAGGWGARDIDVVAQSRRSVALDLDPGGWLHITFELDGQGLNSDALFLLSLIGDGGDRVDLRQEKWGASGRRAPFADGRGARDPLTTQRVPSGPARIVGQIWGTDKRFDAPVRVVSGRATYVTLR